MVMKKYFLTKIAVATILALAGTNLAFAQTRDARMNNSTITPVTDLVGLFLALDKDDDGAISMEEFRHLSAAMAGIGAGQTARAGEPDSSAFRVSSPTDDDLLAMYRHLDTNGDGKVTLSEFALFNQVLAEQGGKR
jgi:Ca2+-binding EF-hand superfamily protein